MLDAAILGGGPAGCAAAISLRQLCPYLNIALLEGTSYEQWRAGETLSPAGRELLLGLGCWRQFREQNFLESFGSCAAWGSNHLHENEFLFSARGNGWHLDRQRFDAMLGCCTQDAGVHVLRDTRFIDAETPAPRGEWKLSIRRNGRRESLHARFVIDATGRSAAFAVKQGARRQVHDNLIGVFLMFQFQEDALADSRTLVEAHSDGWWYSSVLPDARCVVAWMSDADLIRSRNLHHTDRWLEHLSHSRFTAERVRKAAPQEPIRTWAAQSQRLDRFCGEDWIATGDAAGTFDPLSSAGIVKALRWGKMASFAAADYFAGRAFSTRYESLLHAEYESYLNTRQRFYQMERRWPESPFWSRRIAGPAVLKSRSPDLGRARRFLTFSRRGEAGTLN